MRSLELGSLGKEEKLGYQMLEGFINRELFTFNEMRLLANNPMRQTGFLNVGGYIRRDYAPISDRVNSASEALSQVPRFLEVLDTALDQEVGRPVLEMSIESYEGMARFYQDDLPKALAGFSDKELVLQRQLV